MSLRLRLFLIFIAWAACGLVCWKSAPADYGFKQSAPMPSHLPMAKTKEAAFYKEEVINDSQDIPFAHVASIEELNDHTLMATWYGGPYEYCHDNIIYVSKLHGSTWQEPHAIMSHEQAEHDLGRPIKCLGNPLMLANPDGSLRLLFVTIAMGKWSGSQLNSCLSHDEGVSWSPVERLTLSPLCNLSELVRNRPVKTARGWCLPIYQELLGKFPELLWLEEKGGALSARKSRVAGGCATLQPSLVPLDDKRAIILLRDYTPDRKIFISRTEDGGLSWSKPKPTTLFNPDSGISGLRLQDESLLVAFNNSPSNRCDLSLARSDDEGRNWTVIARVENDPENSFSYPYLMQSSDGIIRLAYSWDGNRIKVMSFNQSWLHDQEAKQRTP